jgi:hypothetical protein
MLYPTAKTTFIGLIDQARQFDAIKDSENPIALTMIYNPNAAPKYGSFKRALFGHLSYPIFLVLLLFALNNVGTFARPQVISFSTTTIHKSPCLALKSIACGGLLPLWGSSIISSKQKL